MRLIVTNPALKEALEAQGKDWTTFTRQEMRTVVCANCHVEYYFKGDDKYLTFPWAKGTDIDQIIAYYEESVSRIGSIPMRRHPCSRPSIRNSSSSLPVPPITRQA